GSLHHAELPGNASTFSEGHLGAFLAFGEGHLPPIALILGGTFAPHPARIPGIPAFREDIQKRVARGGRILGGSLSRLHRTQLPDNAFEHRDDVHGAALAVASTRRRDSRAAQFLGASGFGSLSRADAQGRRKKEPASSPGSGADAPGRGVGPAHRDAELGFGAAGRGRNKLACRGSQEKGGAHAGRDEGVVLRASPFVGSIAQAGGWIIE
ncbi:hypothetical protein T484DRAFT_3648551, partial [Baffinella frigidus]